MPCKIGHSTRDEKHKLKFAEAVCAIRIGRNCVSNTLTCRRHHLRMLADLGISTAFYLEKCQVCVQRRCLIGEVATAENETQGPANHCTSEREFGPSERGSLRLINSQSNCRASRSQQKVDILVLRLPELSKNLALCFGQLTRPSTFREREGGDQPTN